MKGRLPRLDVIEAFIEAARAPSFRVAAERVSVSPAAFSRRIQAFARALGHEVFEPGPAGMRLTEAGRACLERLEPLYIEMRRATLELAARDVAGRVTVSLSHSLAVGWLIPKLEAFCARWPGVEVAMHTDRTMASVRTGQADLGICAADVDTRGLHCEHLLDMEIAAVASPERAATFPDIGARLDGQPILSMVQHPDLWAWYARETGAFLGGEVVASASFDVLHAMYEAAAAGLGIAAGSYVTLKPHLESGRLRYLGLPSARYPGGYRLAGAASRFNSPPVKAFWEWLRDVAREGVADWTPTSAISA